MNKWRIYGLGGITILMAPLGWVIAGFPKITDFLELRHVDLGELIGGLLYGMLFGLFMILVTNTQAAEKSFRQQIQLVRSMKLNLFDILFLSLCAGFGEELLFRAGLQLWVHPLIGSVFFVAIHGYLNPKDWDTSKYGLLVLVFIIGVSYGFEWYGLWFSMIAHASYDFVLFYYWSKQKMITDHFHE